MQQALWWLAPLSAIVALAMALYFYKRMMGFPEGDEKMRAIASFVRQGANAYLRRQYKVVAIFFVIFAVLLAIMAFALKVQSRWTPLAFLSGGLFSALSGYLGMRAATFASSRTTEGAKTSLNRALQVAFRSGAVMGLVVVGLALLYISIFFLFLTRILKFDLPRTTVTMLSFGMGASAQALFARVGGGIFTKAADVGADLVGKVEAGIPEDDPRNPATIADNVGDNVGDVAGMGADLYESYCNSILATCTLGVAAGLGFSGVAVPMAIAGLGTLFSILGIFMVRTHEEASQAQLLRGLNRGVYLSTILTFICAILVILWVLPEHKGLAVSALTGLLAGVIVGWSTQYYTSERYRPTRSIAEEAKTGPATVIIAGLSVGMQSIGIPVLVVAGGILVSFAFASGFTQPALGLFGIGLAAVGMLSTLGITLATDAYGPIADNAGGNAEMSGLGPEVRKRTDALDALGNTTAATGKGFAIGSAALTTLVLLAAYLQEVKANLVKIASGAADEVVPIEGAVSRLADLKAAGITFFIEKYNVHLMNPKVIVGMFLGAMMVLVFCSLTMRAVGRAASKMVEEVRRQFREIAGIMQGKAEPDYAACVDISTRAAQREMILPSLLALIIPIVAGLILGVAGVMGLLTGALAAGFAVAIMMANAGGAWDNAKKYIEGGQLGGKGSDAHKASVVGDTVGDPFKDTSGPSLNILLKLMSMVAVVSAGLVVKFAPVVAKFLHISF
ncbi:MAG: potassium transporter [Planctomycetes bacterium DG_23]|nr:MAG: potassium transporter [Planctomycetes bacterium DG_23]